MKTKQDFNNALFRDIVIPEGLNGVKSTVESLLEKIALNALALANRAFEEGANYAMDELEPTIDEMSGKLDFLKHEVSWDVRQLRENLDFKFLEDERKDE